MKYKAVIFDLDGVICHTDEYHYLAWKQIADEEGVPFDRRDNDRLRGVSRMESLNIILEKATRVYPPEERAALAAKKNERYRQLLGGMTPADLSEEVRRTLNALRADGLTLAIGSSSRNARFILERIGLGTFFDHISDGNNITRSKPDPEVFLKAAEMCGLPPCDCLVVEDAKAGIEAARAGNFDSAGIGDAADCGLATYRLTKLGDLLANVT